MISAHRFLCILTAIAGFALGSFARPSNASQPSLLANHKTPKSLESRAPGQTNDPNDSVVVEYGSCDQISCMNLYPADRTVEGRKILTLNAAGVNDRGQIVGLCVLDGPVGNYPFVREPDGRIWIFRTPSTSGQGEFTDVSDLGEAVGFYQDETSKTQVGFLMNSQGKWALDIKFPSNPCPNNSPYLNTQPNGINQDGEIIGNYGCTQNPGDPIDAIFKGNGFYRAADGTFFQVKYENAVRTVAGKISNNGLIIGYYAVDDNTWLPFVAKKEEVLKPISK
jgi:hypothetical protein